MSTFNQIFEKNQYNIHEIVKKSKGWFDNEVRALAVQRVSPYYLMRANVDRNRQRITPGELYMFYYDPKHKDVLPHYDTFPLVFPFKALPDGFIGLNMHYLHYKLRVKLLDQLLRFKTDSKFDENTKLRMSWATLSGMSQLNVVKPCVHRYLVNYIQSPLKKVNSSEWATAMMLPVERFVGSPKMQVWNNL